MPPPSPPPAAVLVEELIEEILLRFPPDEPATLFRASLVCRPWCRLISGPRFRRRCRKFHRTPPVLGFLCGRFASDGVHIARFVATSSCSPLADRRYRLFDARHGRVLLLRSGEPGRENVLLVWDPITDEQREIPFPRLTRPACTWKAAVVCAAAAGGACDHLDCHRGAFLVVLVISYSPETFIWTYSSDVGSWSDPIFTQHHDDCVDLFYPSALVGNALYFEFWSMKRVLKYDLEFHEMSVIGLPSSVGQRVGVFRTTDDGCLGFATVHKSKLYMWSRKHGPEADAVWTRDRVVELETLLSSNAIRTDPL